MKSSGVLVLCFTLLVFQPFIAGQEPSRMNLEPVNFPPEVVADANSSAPTPVTPSPTRLHDATPVKLRLLHSLNSKTTVLDDPLNFVLAEDVVVNGTTVVKAGAFAIGRVRQATPARTLGRGAQLGLEMQYLKVGRVRVPLRGSEHQFGNSKTGDTVALVALFGLSGLIKHGSEIEVKEGSIFVAYVNQDTDLPTQPDEAPLQK